jgi:hypothetical protein
MLSNNHFRLLVPRIILRRAVAIPHSVVEIVRRAAISLLRRNMGVPGRKLERIPYRGLRFGENCPAEDPGSPDDCGNERGGRVGAVHELNCRVGEHGVAENLEIWIIYSPAEKARCCVSPNGSIVRATEAVMPKVEIGKWYMIVECRNPTCRGDIALGEPQDTPNEPQHLPDTISVICPHCGHPQLRKPEEVRFAQGQLRY